MKNSRYIPFERNRYFYGKLLTVRDFETEQKYMNDKRRLINRLMHGAGVVSGLQVLAVDDKSISVEMGVAIDSYGREIVVPSPVTLKLSTVSGFSNNEYAKNVYLCIAYDEKGKEPVHSVNHSGSDSGEISEYNRLYETYKLFIREEAPDPSTISINHLIESTAILYEDSQMRIYQTAPKYINPGEIFEVTIHIDKALQTPPVFLQFQIDSEFFTKLDGETNPYVTFQEPLDHQQTEYKISFFLQAKKTYDHHKQSFSIQKDEFVLKLGDQQMEVGTDCTTIVEIIEGSIKDKLIDSYFEQTLEQAMSATNDQAIYLAKISLLQMGPTYMIEKVEQVPFQEYVYNPTILYKIEQACNKTMAKTFLARSTTKILPKDEEPYMWVDFNDEKSLFDFTLALPEQNTFSDEVRTGTVVIEIEEQKKQGRWIFSRNEHRFYSDEIEHGLGEGSVFIEVGLEEKNDKDELPNIFHMDDKVYYGDWDVFQNSEYETKVPNISIGTIVYPKKGTFRIGVRTEGVIDEKSIKVKWWAFKKIGDMKESETIALTSSEKSEKEEKDEGEK